MFLLYTVYTIILFITCHLLSYVLHLNRLAIASAAVVLKVYQMIYFQSLNYHTSFLNLLCLFGAYF